MAKKPKGSRTLILTIKSGSQRRITIPSGYAITFGPLIPGLKQISNGHTGVAALRIYDSDKDQVACFTDVLAFRDASLMIEEKVTRTERKVVRKNSHEGSRDVEVEARVTEWVNPDIAVKVPSEYMRIPSEERPKP